MPCYYFEVMAVLIAGAIAVKAVDDVLVRVQFVQDRVGVLVSLLRFCNAGDRRHTRGVWCVKTTIS